MHTIHFKYLAPRRTKSEWFFFYYEKKIDYYSALLYTCYPNSVIKILAHFLDQSLPTCFDWSILKQVVYLGSLHPYIVFSSKLRIFSYVTTTSLSVFISNCLFYINMASKYLLQLALLLVMVQNIFHLGVISLSLFTGVGGAHLFHFSFFSSCWSIF